MKKITVLIDDEIFKSLEGSVYLIDFYEGCVNTPDKLSQAMMGIIKKIQEGKDEITLARKGKEIK